ncbi:MAG: hypothetical protein KKA19_09440, partial [Candidatus Margulisbacteria bacterium]|nr:hypothetical protein [Candidatus Margulisiibacteriota bacterium]
MTEYLRALWVWSPQHLSNLEEKKKLFEFCKQEKITHLYYQVIFNEKSFPHLTASVEGYEHYRDFIREAHSLKIKVYALNSRPHGVLRKGHAKIMAEIKALTEFNNKSRPEEQFDGAHYAFDIYMLDGFSGKSIRTFLVQLLQICKRARNFLFMRRPHLNFSVDMPFWFLTHQKGPLPRLVFDLRWKEAGEHLLDQ